jgi:hypothetical protein
MEELGRSDLASGHNMGCSGFIADAAPDRPF